MRSHVLIIYATVLFTSCLANRVQTDELGIPDDGIHAIRELVGPNKGDSRAAKMCEPGQFSDDYNNCYKCYDHDALCESSNQCCSSANMACWKINFNVPRCMCNPNFAWNATAQECVYYPTPSVLVISVYIALAAGCIITVFAILYYVVVYCKMKIRQRRHGDTLAGPQSRVQRRRAPHVHNDLDDSNAEPLPYKPPTYEDVFGLPTLTQVMVRPYSGSIRSLPPAYTPAEENNPPPTDHCSQATQPNTTEENTEVKQGIVNPAFNNEHHI